MDLGAVTIMLLAWAAGGFLAHRLGLPSAVGYLATGMALSPYAFGEGLVPEGVVDNVAELGVLVLLFFIGLELDLKRLTETLRKTALTIPFDLALPVIAVATGARLLGWSFGEAMVLGLAVAMSSTLFGERIMHNGLAPAGRQRVLGVLVSEDIAAVIIIALVVVFSGDSSGGWQAPALGVGELLFWLLLLAAGAILLIPRILDEVSRRHAPDLLVLWALGLIVLFGYLGHIAGSAELGALLAGVAAAEAGSRYVARNALSGVRDVALAAFFFSAGLAVDAPGLPQHWPIVLTTAGLFLLAKILVHVPASAASGFSLKQSLGIAFSLGTVGEFSLILLAVALQGTTHPALSAAVIGAMVVLLPTSSLLMKAVPTLERAFWKLPRPLRQPLVWAGHSARRPSSPRDVSERRHALRNLVANGVLLAAWLVLGTQLQDWYLARSRLDPLIATVIAISVLLAVAIPLLWGTYKAYRSLVWSLVGLRPGERVGAGKVRARLVDAWVGISVVIVLALVSLNSPQTLPVLAAAAVFAIGIAALAWRQLAGFHRTLERSLSRVLGHDEGATKFLDEVLTRYPWGVRFAALSVPPGSPLANRKLGESRIRELTGATVALAQRGRKETVNPPIDYLIQAGDTLILLGDAHQLGRAEALVVTSGDALPLAASSNAAEVLELPIGKNSPWCGKPLGEVDIKGTTGTLVIGVWEIGDPHPLPYHPKIILDPEDRLILLGTQLQLDRARAIADGA